MRFLRHTLPFSLERGVALPLLVAGVLSQACSSPRAVCWGTCDTDADCGSGRSCDPTLGYCVETVGDPDNIEACELDVDEVWVCADQDVTIPLGTSSRDESVETQSVEVRGLPKGVSNAGNQLEGRFEPGEHQVAWGNGPGRNLLTVNATNDCPALVTESQPQVCTGRSLDAKLSAKGGSGDVRWSLTGDTKGYTIDEEGNIRGVVNGTDELVVVMEDERNVRVEAPLKIESLAGCPSIRTTSLPAGCADSVFEWPIDVAGADVQFRTPTIISDNPTRDVERLGLEINASEAQEHRLRAKPQADAVGFYKLGLIADNGTANDQAEIPFEVRDCEEKSRVVCCNDEVTVELGPGEWTLTSPDNNPMRANVAILGSNQLSFARNDLAKGTYTLNLNNPKGETESLLLLLSAPGEEGCATDEDAGSSNTNSDAGEGSSTGDAGPPITPPLLPRLSDGCVGKPYNATYDWGTTIESGPTLSPDIGLTARASGSSVIFTGTPTAAFPDSTLSLTVNGQTRELNAVLRADCAFAYTAYSPESGNTLYVGSLETGLPNVRSIDDFVAPSYEVAQFRVSPTGTHILVWTRSSTDGAGDQLFLVDSSGQQGAQSVAVSSEAIAIQDAAWSPNGSKFSVIYDTVSPDGGAPERYLSVVYDLGSNPAAPITTLLPLAADPVWPSESVACVVTAYYDDSGFDGTTCFFWDAATPSLLGSPNPHHEGNVNVQGRTFDGGILTVNPDYSDIRYWQPGVLNIMHDAHFAAPNGQYVGTIEEVSGGSSLHISPSIDDTDFMSGAVGSVSGCDEVVAWSYNGQRLACVSGTELLLVAIDGAQLVVGHVPNTADHDLVRRKVFTANDRYYVFAASPGNLGYVDMAAEPAQWHVELLPLQDSSPPDFTSIEPAGTETSILVQDSDLRVIELPHGQKPTAVQTSLSRSLPPTESAGCVRKFKNVGFTNWCGGDDVHNRFLSSADGLSVLYVSAGGKLIFVDTFDGEAFTELEGDLVVCDPTVNTCEAFAFGVN